VKSISLLWLLPLLAMAHPHTFIDLYPKVTQERIEIRWLFDEMSSNILMMDFDLNKDGVFDAKESERIKSETFIYLKEYHYYAYLFTNKRVEQPSKLLSFQATIKGAKVEYTFTLPRPKNLKKIEFYDSELFSAFVLKEEFLNDSKWRIEEIDNDYYFGYAMEAR
jgi:ABC-type uncharacterized transport system substrate-binding protein